MPFPAMAIESAHKVAEELRRIAAQIDRLAARPGGERAHAELTQIGNRLARIGDALEKGAGSGRVNAQQIRSIAANFEGIADALRKGLGR